LFKSLYSVIMTGKLWNLALLKLTTTRRHMGKYLDNIKKLNIAVELIRLGARVSIVRSHCDVSLAIAQGLSREIYGKRPVKGLLPFSEEWFYRYKSCVHSMLFLRLYDQAKGKDTFKLINAYKKYEKHLKEKQNAPLLDINRADLLINLINATILQVDICEKCSRKHVRFNARNICLHCNKPPRSKELNIF